ncbi:ABC transporter permease [Streptomyces sp. B3I8]|uniref:ABC transporter permease n=1 Tax=Streptomyces sp. B3I8 TaxID=3042303 RepID=UPI002786A219|nr:ABC transporter permease [Streptomyces sp. B3I8]MDQ0790772.1 ABC-2 type transport system permease protein [Streptomyces sp. B3I8]
MSTLLAAAKVQWHTSIRAPEHLLVLATAPLYTLIFLSVFRDTDRPDLVANAVIGTGLLGIWFVAVNVAGGVIQNERWMSTLELVIVAPRPLALIMCGRILPVMLIGSLALGESWLMAVVAFGVDLPVQHPVLALVILLVTLAASACTATMLAALFVMSRNTEMVQAALSYPFYVLGGLVFPLSSLPNEVEFLGRFFYLSWAADLLRDSVTRSTVDHAWERIATVAGMGTVALFIGVLLLRKVSDRARTTGSVSLA